nr:MAG TPA: hypothetical protein [Caudoviricetes sp.]
MHILTINSFVHILPFISILYFFMLINLLYLFIYYLNVSIILSNVNNYSKVFLFFFIYQYKAIEDNIREYII